jgi:hypothetical protein
MITYVRVPTYIYDRYVSWKGSQLHARRPWLDRAVNSEGYYYNDIEGTGSTFTMAQVQTIKQNIDMPVSINFLYPICNQELALLTQTKPSMKTIPSDGRAKEYAQVLDKMKHGVLYTSNANVEIENAIKDMLISGIGHLMVTPTDFYEDGVFGLRVAHIPYDEIILDINAKKRTLEDMEGYFVEKEFTLPKAIQLYGDIFSQITDETGNPVNIRTFVGRTWVEGETTEKVKITTTLWDTYDRIVMKEKFETVSPTMYLIKDPITRASQYMFAENLPPDAQSILSQAQDQYPGVYVKRTLIAGDFSIFEEILPISEYALITLFFEWGGRPYRSYGMIHFTKSMQEASDKILQIMMLNGILSNNAGWKAPKGSIAEEDRRKWEDYGNNPRVIKEYVPVVRENQVFVPEKEVVSQLGNFYPMVLQMLKQGNEYSSGITAILQGNAQEAGGEVFSSLQQYQNAAMMRVIFATSHVNYAMAQLGNVLTQYLVAHINPGEYYFFDEKGSLNELQIAQEIINDFRKYKYRVISIPATAMPTQRLAIGTELMKIAQSSPDPSERSVLTQKALQLSDIPEYEDIQEQMNAVKQAQGQLNQLQEAYNRLLETSKQMENKYIDVTLQNKILMAGHKVEKDIAVASAVATNDIGLASDLAKAKIEGKQNPQGE